MASPHPAAELSTWPYPDVYHGFMRLKDSVAPRHEHWSTTESTEMLDAYSVFPYLDRVVNVPTLMVVAEGDDITLWDLEIAAFNRLRTTRKQLVVLPAITHMSLYGDQSKLEIAAGETTPWLLDNLAGTRAFAAPA